MTQSTDTRSDFELWANSYGTWEVKRDDDHDLGITGYTDVELTIAWHAWQAARCSQLAAVPYGWKLVPVIPTMDMIAAGNRKRQATVWLTSGINAVPATYKAMLDVAPKPR